MEAIFVMIIGFCIFMYFLPSLVAMHRDHRNFKSIFIFNLFLGFTCIVWVGALAWAFSNNVLTPEEAAAKRKKEQSEQFPFAEESVHSVKVDYK